MEMLHLIESPHSHIRMCFSFCLLDAYTYTSTGECVYAKLKLGECMYAKLKLGECVYAKLKLG